jgi:hypothetical protein
MSRIGDASSEIGTPWPWRSLCAPARLPASACLPSGIDQFFRSLTHDLGDLHHYALRAQGANQTVFRDPTLARLFGNWSAAECREMSCVEALTHVDIKVDVAALRELVGGRLERIRAGASVREAELPWPLIQTQHLPANAPNAATGQPPSGQASKAL